MLYVLLKIFNVKNLKVNLLLYFFRILIFVTPRPPGIFCLFLVTEWMFLAAVKKQVVFFLEYIFGKNLQIF